MGFGERGCPARQEGRSRFLLRPERVAGAANITSAGKARAEWMKVLRILEPDGEVCPEPVIVGIGCELAGIGEAEGGVWREV